MPFGRATWWTKASITRPPSASLGGVHPLDGLEVRVQIDGVLDPSP